MSGISKVLVTGGAGFIGSHLVDRLLTEGFDVTVLDDFSTGSIRNISLQKNMKRLRLVRGDIRDVGKVRKATRGVDAVLHEAALINVSQSVKDPLLYNDVNLTGTLNLLKVSMDFNVKRIVLASSAAVYGTSKPQKKREDVPPEPISPYAVSKFAAENYAQVFNKLYGLKTISLRYFNVYGSRQCLTSGYGGVITTFVDRLLKGQPPVIYGNGDQTRDFVHVDDVVSANMLALTSKDAVVGVFNIGSGKATTILELAQILTQITNAENREPVFAENRVGDIKHSLGDINKASQLLGFQPKVPLRDGLSRLVRWQSAHRRDPKMRRTA